MPSFRAPSTRILVRSSAGLRLISLSTLSTSPRAGSDAAITAAAATRRSLNAPARIGFIAMPPPISRPTAGGNLPAARLFDHSQNLIDRSDAAHARKHQVHEHVMRALVVNCGTGVAKDDQVIVQVAGGENRRREPHVGRTARDDQRIDLRSAQR